MNHRSKHQNSSEALLSIRCRKSYLFLPVICWIVFAWMLVFAPEIEDITARVCTYGLVASVFLWLSYEVVRQVFTEIAAGADAVSVIRLGRVGRVWQYDQIERIERTHNRSEVRYYVYHGGKCIFRFSSNFPKSEEMYHILVEKTSR